MTIIGPDNLNLLIILNIEPAVPKVCLCEIIYIIKLLILKFF